MLRRALLAALIAPVAIAAIKTGPAIGERIPAFEAIDQNGHHQTFETLRGPHGLALLFVRSADW